MNYIKKIILFLHNFFHKEHIKMIEAPVEESDYDEKSKFIQSLKIIKVKKYKKFETLICEGDGLGIQNKITY